MRSEFQFFMGNKDQDDFLEFAEAYVDEIDKSPKACWKLFIDDCYIQFIPSRIHDGDLISGRIAIATHGLDKEPTCEKRAEAEKIYKKFRNWLKKTYTNKMTCRNIYRPESAQLSKHLWVGPDAKKWKQENEGCLKQIPGGFVVFEFTEDT
ncbi:hypothetical protein [uncultured Desulfuromonas sp.]|uniref:hypothetical protein n=1 Tax=uncultured Desulfuromonas sp. TaxID=181013 RepID=UPI002AAB7242|nr:hypothetical protein [uncultured Desulfuromonas sp.]